MGIRWGGETESRRMAYSRGLRRMCKRAKIEYKSPHKIRHGYGVYGVKHARTIEELKAISRIWDMKAWGLQIGFMES